MADSAGEKKHDATPHRRQKARESGQVARSQDLGSALVLLLAVLLLRWSGPQLLNAIAEIMQSGFTQPNYWTLDSRSSSGLVSASLLECLVALLPIMLGVCGIILVNSFRDR